MESKADLQKAPINYLYYFVTNDRLKQITKYFGSAAALTIQQKRANQAKLLANYYGSTTWRDAKAPQELTDLMVAQYGMTPSQIITALMCGKTVAGKNWKQGVYGVGATQQTTYKGNANISVDMASGKIYDMSSSYDAGLNSDNKPIYSTNAQGVTYISGYSRNINGTVYTSKIGNNDYFYADTYGNAADQYFADGSTYTADKASNAWSTIETMMPMFNKFIEWLLSLFGSGDKKLITAQSTAPQQTEFITESGTAGTGTTSIASVGMVALLAAGMLLVGNKKKKK